MSTPLYQLKAEFFKTLGHPARIRILELLSEREHAVAEMLPEVGIEPAHLSHCEWRRRKFRFSLCRRCTARTGGLEENKKDDRQTQGASNGNNPC